MQTPLFDDDKRLVLEVMRHSGMESVKSSLEYIDAQRGSRKACVMDVQGHAEKEALHAWFNEDDLAAFRQWMYVSAKLQLHLLPGNCVHGYPCLRFWKALLSNHPELIEHVAWFPEHYPLEMTDDFPWIFKTRQLPCHNNHQIWLHQLALRGDWEGLRCEAGRALNQHPKSTKKYVLTDVRYLLALAERDLSTMQECLADLLKPKNRIARNDFPLREDLISVDVLVLAKLAWLHGIEIDPQSDYVPREWLPMTPNAEYIDPYDFMKTIQLP